jgi:hypothetical protein
MKDSQKHILEPLEVFRRQCPMTERALEALIEISRNGYAMIAEDETSMFSEDVANYLIENGFCRYLDSSHQRVRYIGFAGEGANSRYNHLIRDASDAINSR